MATTDLWTYRDSAWTGTALVGMDVEATDGSIGKIETATGQYIVVDTGPWIFGKKVMLPAGVVERVDLDAEKVFVNRTKEEIKNAPEFDDSRFDDDTYRGELSTYYGNRR